MKKYLFVVLACFLFAAAGTVAKETVKDAKTFAVENIIWHGQSGFEVHNSLTIFTDPYKLKKSAKADFHGGDAR